MNYTEKNTWAFLSIAVIGYAIYAIIVLPQLATTPPGEIVYWVPMLWTIGGAIVVGILAGIVLAITTPKADTVEDERDIRINRMGERTGNSIVVIAAIASLVLCWLRVDWFWIANLLYLGFVISGVLSSLARLGAYRRGLPSW